MNHTEKLVDLLAEAGLAGRGGASFSTARKVAAAQDSRATLIVNACDGELDAAKDWFVVSRHLDELVHGARSITSDVRYAARRGSPTLNLLLAAGLPALEVPDRYVASEESAIVSIAHGDFARPVSRDRPLVFGGKDAEGRRLRPTLVLNAETVWRVSQIIHNGPGWFRSFGTPAEPGPRLVTVAGAVHHPGVFESAAGTPIADLLRRAGAAPYRAVSVGGLSSGFLRAAEIEQLRWDSEVLMAHGCTIGSGVLRVVGADECPVEYVVRTLEIAAAETAGQCGPCMFGVPAVAADFAAVAAGDAGRVVSLHRRLGLLPGRGACHFPDGVAQYLAGALRVFGDDLDAHLGGRCVAEPDRRNAHAS
ncbi:MAG TPA: NADH-ubiquinone oxidoreductase-F iron-sulfur binding region domain-containing protein [Flexivirga sp.]|uniref:NADH-ubiquinone oxidoreductase-F iron-sulfur binding region domain-containing protein n=1 Tax=Flexivirga sp. TaxID=1962927 RepID=UPI002B883A1F|nr:NADH-ubiquinone oxidoreductase-F iron-sulfur binding region domain-containing protein [Flexivirga sp.]HWC23756.1 NADH-ubiquinone oxidoreductase-F iron-sulfur binding region domain-containing protein [Flexivirga sp.]